MLFKILVFLLELVSLSYASLNISNLKCFSDYEDTMACDFTSDVPLNCSAYSLELVSQRQEHFMCTFMKSSSNSLSRCGCMIKMHLVVNTEIYTRNLMEGGKVINTTIITSLDNIKPRTPEILSVARLENGNYNITCKTHYGKDSFLSDSLEVQLSYRKKGEADTAWRSISATLPSQEISGSDLEPRSKYTVKARSHSSLYKTHFSDWSQEVEWIVPASVPSMRTMIIPALSVLLIIVICTSYRFWNRVKTQWWDRIPSPGNELKYMLPGNLKVFTPKVYDPWSIQPDALTIINVEEQPWVYPECDTDVSYKNVSSSRPQMNSGIGFCEENRAGSTGSLDLSSSSQVVYKNILLPMLPGGPSPGSTGSTETPCSAAPPGPDSDSCNICGEPGALETPGLRVCLRGKWPTPEQLAKAPSMPTDFDYRPCNGGVTDASPAESTDFPCSSEADILDALLLNTTALTCVLPCGAQDGYESFGEAVARTARIHTNFPACTLSPCEEGYQVLQTMAEHTENQPLTPGEADVERSSGDGPENCTEQDQNLSQFPKGRMPHSDILSHFMSELTAISNLESSASSILNNPPVIHTFIESSYHRV